MYVFRKAEFLTPHLKLQNGSIGFVPTMGAIHDGHLSLLSYSIQKNDQTVCSIFVNPSQFDNKMDLHKYPRPVEADLEMLLKAGVDVVYLPEVEDVYPPQHVDTHFDLGGLDLALEGASRPGHFQGVANVLDRMFRIVNPNDVYFGQKDFQQTVVVKKLIEIMGKPIELNVCPIARETNGLAMSSRNQHLSEDQKNEAATFRASLLELKKRYQTNPHLLSQHVQDAKNRINKNPVLNVEYLIAVEADTLVVFDEPPYPKRMVVLSVVECNGVRLLDNILL